MIVWFIELFTVNMEFIMIVITLDNNDTMNHNIVTLSRSWDISAGGCLKRSKK